MDWPALIREATNMLRLPCLFDSNALSGISRALLMLGIGLLLSSQVTAQSLSQDELIKWQNLSISERVYFGGGGSQAVRTADLLENGDLLIGFQHGFHQFKTFRPSQAALPVTSLDRWEQLTYELLHEQKTDKKDRRKSFPIAPTPDNQILIGNRGKVGRIVKRSAFTGQLTKPFEKRIKSTILSMEVSPDGSTYAASDLDGRTKVKRMSDGKTRYTFEHQGAVYTEAYSRDGRLLVTGDKRGLAHVWDLSNGQQRITLAGHTGPVRAVEFSPDGAYVFSVSDDQTFRIWDASTGALLKTHKHHTRAALSVAVSANRIATGGADGTVNLYDSSNFDHLIRLGNLGIESGLEVGAMVFTHGGEGLYVGGENISRIISIRNADWFINRAEQFADMGRSCGKASARYACTIVGRFFETGHFVSKDWDIAEHYYEKGCAVRAGTSCHKLPKT